LINLSLAYSNLLSVVAKDFIIDKKVYKNIFPLGDNFVPLKKQYLWLC